MFASYMNYIHRLYDNMTVPELRVEESELNKPVNIGVRYTRDLKKDVIGKSDIPKEVWAEAQKNGYRP